MSDPSLPDDPLLHVCNLTYFSDLPLVGAILETGSVFAGSAT